MENIIITEKTNPSTVNIDLATSFEIAQMINNEDLKLLVSKEVPIDTCPLLLISPLSDTCHLEAS